MRLSELRDLARDLRGLEELDRALVGCRGMGPGMVVRLTVERLDGGLIQSAARLEVEVSGEDVGNLFGLVRGTVRKRLEDRGVTEVPDAP